MMGKACIGICGRYDTTGFAGYARGYKWCSRCHLFIKVHTVMCPCCGGFLRIVKRGPKPVGGLQSVLQKAQEITL